MDVAVQRMKNGSPAAAQRRAEPIRTPKIGHIVADRLRRQIVMGELRPGDTLPPEAQLMVHFAISRPALREALRILEAESLIAIGRGIRGGATILQPTIEKVAQYGTFYLVANGTTHLEIHEARTLIEPAVAALLARRPRKDVIAGLRGCVERGMAALAVTDLAAAILAINEFHKLLVDSSENNALRLLVGMLHDIVVANVSVLTAAGTADTVTRTRGIAKSTQALSRLTDVIEEGKPDEAERFWREYMEKSGRVLASSGLGSRVIALHDA